MRGMLLVVLALIQLPSAREVFDLGRSHDTALWDAFNRGYELTPADPIDRAEVVTEFRRAVLLVHEESVKGAFRLTDQDVATAMAPFAGMVSFVVQVRMHPMNTYTRPPLYDLYIQTGAASKPLAAKPLKRDPVYPPGHGPGAAMTAFRLDGTFARADIESASAPVLVVVDDRANIVWKARLDLSRYR